MDPHQKSVEHISTTSAQEVIQTPIPRGDARFVLENQGELIAVKIKASDSLVQNVAQYQLGGDRPEPQRVMTVNYLENTISIYPQLIAFSERLYLQKYKKLREILVEFEPDGEIAADHYDIVELLKQLPNGFIRDPAFGLGVVKEMRPLIHAIESIDGVSRLEIRHEVPTRVENGTFYLASEEYRLLQLSMNRTTRYYQAESLADRQIIAYNASIHRALPEKFPLKERPYKPGTIYKLLGGSQSSAVILKGNDRLGLLQAIAGNANRIASRDPQEFVQLQKDIEIVSLNKLIDSVQRHILRNSRETIWQKLLELNPFILTMLFGQPIVLLQASASVGGQKLTGAGTKISDFLTKNSLTNNAALVELKRPNTPVLAKTEYRGGVYAPSSELMASITQVLDQRLKLVTSIAQTLYNSRVENIEVTAVECVVVAGLAPTEQAESRSFELFRSSLKDVRVITFDEVLEKLHILRELLAGERYVSATSDETEYEKEIFGLEEDEYEGNDDFEGPDDEDLDPRD